MKKYLLFAAALLGLVACNNNEPENVTPHKVILHATVENGGANGPRRVAPVDPTAETVNFKWQEGDQVILKNASGKTTFTVISSTINGASADFEGEPLTDMSSYTVHYGYDPDDEVHNVAYIENSFKPFITGEGNNEGFNLNNFYPVLKFNVQAGNHFEDDVEDYNLLSVKYSLDKEPYKSDREYKVVLTDVNKLVKFEASITIYLPVLETATEGFRLEFIVQKENGTEDRYKEPNACCVLNNTNDGYGINTTFDLTGKRGKIVTMSDPLRLSIHVDHGG